MTKNNYIAHGKNIILLLRPHQYVKNAFIFLPVFFGHMITDYGSISRAAWAFLIFCLASSGVYAFNDICDIEYDKKHSVKCKRPIANGSISIFEAGICSALLIACAILLGISFLNIAFLSIVVFYVTINIGYSLWFKHFALIDIAIIAIGFVIRVYTGAIVTGIWLSQWLILITFLLSLFIAFAKRRDDLMLLNAGIKSRNSLDGYNMEFVASSMVLMAGVVVVSYIMYTLSPEVIAKHKSENLYMTSFWVIMGLLRYMQITFVENRSGSPTVILFKDAFLKIMILLWLVNVLILIYYPI